jgi:6-phosphogluconolactonase
VDVETVSNLDEMADRAAQILLEVCNRALKSRERCFVALSGGSTPIPFHKRLTEAPYRESVPWHGLEVYWGDDRAVPPASDVSNYRMAKETLLDHVGIPPQNVHRIEGEREVTDAARLYDLQLHGMAQLMEEPLPRFDIMIQGIGANGHTASLFPGMPQLDDTEAFAVPVVLPEDMDGADTARERVTMTFPVINAARNVLFLVEAKGKEDALRRVREGDMTAPASRVKPTDGTLLWLVVGDF